MGSAPDQLDFYALLWALQHRELPAAVEATSVASGERYRLEPKASDVTATADRVLAIINTLRSGFDDADMVPRRGGPGCRFCPWRAECAEGIAALRVMTA